MRFVKTQDLKRGMRIGRPIYSKRGDLLYDRDLKLTDSDIVKIRSLKTVGIFVLDAVEPLPPMSAEDYEYEKRRSLNTYALKDELQEILVTHRSHRIGKIAESILSVKYGKKKSDFPLSIRAKEEYVCSHSVNVANLIAMMCAHINTGAMEKENAIYSALLHDIGKYVVPAKLLEGETAEEVDRILLNAQDIGFEIIGMLFDGDKKVMNTCIQAHRILMNHRFGRNPGPEKNTLATALLVVADTFDSMTCVDAMSGAEPKSAVAAVRYMRDYPEVFEARAVDALVASIEILRPGTTVLLSNKKQALVMAEGADDVLRPTVLEVTTNRFVDLSCVDSSELSIVDVVNKLDKRHVVDR